MSLRIEIGIVPDMDTKNSLRNRVDGAGHRCEDVQNTGHEMYKEQSWTQKVQQHWLN